jgi:hypothetical protein
MTNFGSVLARRSETSVSFFRGFSYFQGRTLGPSAAQVCRRPTETNQLTCRAQRFPNCYSKTRPVPGCAPASCASRTEATSRGRKLRPVSGSHAARTACKSERKIVHRPFSTGRGMAKSTTFISIGRVLVAYILAITAGAMTFIPLLLVDNTIRGGHLPKLPKTLASSDALSSCIRIELGAIIAAFLVVAIPMLPVFTGAMMFAKWKSIQHWSYYLSVGIGISISTLILLQFFDHSSPMGKSLMFHGSIFFIAFSIGSVSGAVCWFFLKSTYTE